MQDPIGSFLRMRDFYIAYLDTAFRIDDASVTEERQRLLRSPGTLCTEPLVEPLPRYEAASVELHDLALPQAPGVYLSDFSPAARKAFVELVLAGLFDSEPSSDGPTARRAKVRPYLHQLQMLDRGIRPGMPGIVTSGTGSGKTEAFLLPLLAAICKEAVNWPAPAGGYLKERWWRRSPTYATPNQPLREPWRSHREHEHPGRPQAVRALILYPMNALVEDQLVRLRRTLDSAEAREAMDEHLHGNRIFFGRYTSKTPVTGHRDHPGLHNILALPINHSELDHRVFAPDHPRADDEGMVRLGDIREREVERRRRKQEELKQALEELDDTQREARRHAYPNRDPEVAAMARGSDAPFLFPSVDGAELVTRQDMQATPPDILITNTSMLSAMLAREVDAGIFERTREWLEGNEDAYFYLVLDELHLQRGSSGTEVSYLLRQLVSRLGLDRPDHCHKLRILASSASLPADPPDEADRSASYLWDMFGPLGLGSSELDEVEGKRRWLDAIVPGREVSNQEDLGEPPLRRTAFLDLLDLAEALARQESEYDPVLGAPEPAKDERAEAAWRAVASELGHHEGTLPQLIDASIRKVAALLARACRDEEGRQRATKVSTVARRLFHDLPADASYDDALRAARALLFVRGCRDGLRSYLDTDLSKRPEPLSFRTHTFFRSIEGLYAPARRDLYHPPEGEGERTVEVGPLSIEREARRVLQDRKGREHNVRQLELLYCEACGELFFGGMRPSPHGTSPAGDAIDELLPHEPILDGLPDTAASQRFEELSYQQYVLFWPTGNEPERPEGARNGDPGDWRKAMLERDTGIVRRPPDARFGTAPDNAIAGRLYVRTAGVDKHKRQQDDAGTHMPYACPRCGTDYYPRMDSRYGLSPIRNFRAGFAKTTQILASELFDAQRVSSPDDTSKLVSFSDSRQDAARAALDIEKRHHQDLRRELLVLALKRYLDGKRRSPEEICDEMRLIEAELAEARAAGDRTRRRELDDHLDELEDEYREAREASVALTEVVENPDDPTLAGTGRPASWLIADMARRGIHPADAAGTETYKGISTSGQVKKFAWDELLEVREDDSVYWRDESMGSARHNARAQLVSRFLEATTDVVFSKTYFSLEEAGLGYVAIALHDLPEERRSEERVFELAAVLRVLGDAYRYWPSPFLREEHAPWMDWDDVRSRSTRIRNFATAVWKEEAPSRLMQVLEDLRRAGHANGVIRVRNVRIALAQPDDVYWRCPICGRVHLHRGVGYCTRCHTVLPVDPEGQPVRSLWRENFLARRVVRALDHASSERISNAFRLHCEELTGQTDDPARRQRHFRGIFVGDAFRQKEEIDLLAVTTTMEVGIDIGPLRTVLQANMPPQRFNYQQRVGRAGRRGQAFSMALTICRTRSHDIHYFRQPEAITGDVPPVPFLTKRMPAIAQRLLRKKWLIDAFATLRAEDRAAGRIYPADVASKPDIHGEFLPLARFNDPDSEWRSRLLEALYATRAEAGSFARLLGLGGRLEAPLDVDPDKVHREIITRLEGGAHVATGLGQALAELGLLPMYGMPTRTRNLYLEFAGLDGRSDPVTIDRDLDIAIYEFSPGHKNVKDKFEHLPVGFTPDLHLPRKGNPRLETPAVPFQPDAFGERFRMLRCPRCSAWERLPAESESRALQCRACGGEMHVEDSALCVVPNAFRTDLKKLPEKEATGLSSRHRSVQAEGKPLVLEPSQFADGSARVRLASCLDGEARTYRLNRGPTHDGRPVGFTVVRGSQTIWTQGRRYTLPHQAVDERALTEPAIRKSLQDFRPEPESTTVWLAAPKTTDALFLAPQQLRPGLALGRLPARAEGEVADDTFRWQGVRAAALSATFMVAYRAALELDIDPVELEVLEPRLLGDGLPVLQLTDELVNGAGFCRYLHETEGRVPRITRLLHSMLYDPGAYPRNSFEAEEHADCDTACYRCLLRYGNQQYHGLLDWRLGMTYLRVMTDPEFACGLDGRFTGPGLEGWPDTAHELARQAARRFGTGEPRVLAPFVPAFRLPFGQDSTWILVTHPLWDQQERGVGVTSSVLSEAIEQLEHDGERWVCWDTFNLSRRMVQVRERVRATVGA